LYKNFVKFNWSNQTQVIVGCEDW